MDLVSQSVRLGQSVRVGQPVKLGQPVILGQPVRLSQSVRLDQSVSQNLVCQTLIFNCDFSQSGNFSLFISLSFFPLSVLISDC